MNEIIGNKITKSIFLIVLAFILFNVMGYVIAGIFIAAGFYFIYKKNTQLPVVYEQNPFREETKGTDYYIKELNELRKKIKDM